MLQSKYGSFYALVFIESRTSFRLTNLMNEAEYCANTNVHSAITRLYVIRTPTVLHHHALGICMFAPVEPGIVMSSRP